MIKSVTLKNFRRHENLSVTFGKGITAIMAMNEQGKSTVLEAMLYAMYGSKALRDSLDETVTWGKTKNDLKVELHVQFGARDLVIVRSPTGAEVREAGAPIVTGQTEVTNFASDMIGASSDTASRLMVASQGNLRGSLEQGPKATAQMIEQLADFELFERLMERMQEKLILGSSAILDSQMADLLAQIGNLPDTAPYDFKAALSNIETLTESEASLAALSRDAEASYRALATDVAAESDRWNLKVELKARFDREHSALRDVMDNIKGVSGSDIDAASLEARVRSLTVAVQEAEALHATSQTHSSFEALNQNYPNVWEGNLASYLDECKSAASDLGVKKLTLETLKRNLTVLQTKVVTSSTCTWCGQDFSQLPSVKASNEKLEKEIAETTSSITQAAADVAAAEAYIEALKFLETLAQQPLQFKRLYPQLVRDDDTQYPPKLVWVGPESRQVDLNTVRNSLTEAQVALAGHAKAQEQLARWRQSASQIEKTIKDINTALVPVEGATQEYLANLRERVAESQSRWESAVSDYSNASIKVYALKQEMAAAEAAMQADKLRREMLESQRQDIENQVKTLAFNNALLKKVRAARPIIADKLWNTVLAAVSTMFTRTRGEPSVVTKDKDGFKVNGHSVQSLSGSTLDLLGLAVRVALVRTFLPSCPFMLLDEAWAACDAERTSSGFAFLQSTGFEQIILVTHDQTAHLVADHVVQL